MAEFAPATKDLIRTRDAGCCALCGTGQQHGHIHHRRLRSRGDADGMLHSVSNGVLLCSSCHTWVHDRPTEATEQGFMVPSGRDPSEWAIVHVILGAVFLLPDGGWLSIDEPEDAA